MITNENKKLAQWAMEFALKNGCQASRVSIYNGSSSSFEIRDMKMDRLQQASENSLVIHLFVDGRFGSFSTNRLDKKELESFIRNGIASTRFLAEDKARTLPDSSLYYKGGGADLQLIDPKFDSIQPDDKVTLAMNVCNEMMGKDPRIISVNSSYSDEKDFKYMVDYLHRQKIGIILDWVPAHFPKDAHGLANFDGTAVYEHADPRQGEHPDWGTKIYNYGRPEVKNFLIANALYWVEECHVDGLRVDAVASMLYLDYGKKDGEWVANKYGGNKNLEAIEFFKHLNTVVLGRNHGTVMIAEESTAWPMVTGKAEDDGLGFSLKWNMGWMNDFLEYMKLDPYFRKFNHNKMTFSMTYAYSEKYVLVLSHDEVVHLKCSMLEKMPGELDDKFKNLKAGYTFMFGHPGKKLLFMGQDFGQLREWSEARELDWYLLGEENHQKLQQYVSDLLHIYRKYPALYGADNDPSAFEWINANDGDRSIFSFVRKSPTRRNNILVVCNFTPVARPDYRVGVPKKKQYKLIMNEQGLLPKGKAFKAEKKNCDNREFSFAYPLEAYGVGVFTY